MSHLKDITKELYQKCLNNSIYKSLFLSILIVFFVYKIWGIQFGWLDDVLQSNYFNGLILDKPITHFFTVEILFSNIFNYLYNHFPSVPWYGYFLTIGITFATFNLNYITFKNIAYLNLNKIWGVLIILIFSITFWIEFIILLNFTKVSILLMGTSILCICNQVEHKKKSKISIFIFSISFLTGLLIRPELLYIILPFALLFIFRNFKINITNLSIVAILICCIIVYKLISIHLIDNQSKITNKRVSHMLNITDGLNLYGKNLDSLIESDIKYKALILYYMPDSTFYTVNNLNKWGPSTSLSFKNLIDTKKQLYYEYKRSKYYSDDYLGQTNWLSNLVIFIFIYLTIIIFSIYLYKIEIITRYQLLSQIIIFLSFISIQILVMALSKMEGRVFTPINFVFLTSQLIILKEFCSKSINNHIKKIKILIIFIFIISLLNLEKYNSISTDKRNELIQKNLVINEINKNFKNKYIFFDLWGMSILQTTPFKNIEINPKNKFLNYGEYWSNFIPSYNQYLKRKFSCKNLDFISFYKCLYENKSDIIFIFTDIRVKLIEEYSNEIYGTKIKFKRINNNSALDQLKYSFFSDKINFGYYVFDKSFSDAN